MPKKKSPSFEEALAELETLVETLEKGDQSLEESLKSFERGVELTRLCQRSLDEAVYELLQRELFLSACPMPTSRMRAERVGWRMLGRQAPEYPQIVVESFLEQAGFQPAVANADGDSPSSHSDAREQRAAKKK